VLKFFKHFNLILPQIQNSLLPALIFACAFLGYFLYGEIPFSILKDLHIIFWSLNISSIVILLYFNRRKPLFFSITIMLSYIIINRLKHQYSLDFLSTTDYINLCFFVPLNLTLFYFLPDYKILHKHNIYWLIFLFVQLSICEHLNTLNINLSFNSSVDSINLNSLSVILFILFLICAFIKSCQTGYINDTALFFSGLNIFAGFYYSASSTALCIFFTAATITSFVSLIKNINYSLYYDYLTGLSNRRSYLEESQKFPLKYSLSVICIDNYTHLYKILGTIKMQKLIKMLTNRLSELEINNPIYRYSQDEFIIVFKNDNLKQSFEKLDNIRREIAASEFMFSHKRKGIKITISGCVSEKKRSDANANEVLHRARNTLQKTYQFTQNLISKA